MSTTMDHMQQQDESLQPTARSPQLLLQIFNAYPILESILSCSHRSGIINLARTCRALHLTFTVAISRLPRAFPNCSRGVEPCYLCKTPVCEDCRHLAQRQEIPSETLAMQHWDYAVVGRRNPGSTQEISKDVRWLIHGARVFRRTKGISICELCFHIPEAEVGKPVQPEWVLLLSPALHLSQLWNAYVTTIWWDDIPNVDNACTCAMFAAGCDALPHIVRVESVPIRGERVALARKANVSAEFRSKMVLRPRTVHLSDTGMFYMPYYVI
ncbi:hypothetical protein BGX38DRAFT_1223960, partial [Terfezia claveryi]